jgi:hypothetical protein
VSLKYPERKKIIKDRMRLQCCFYRVFKDNRDLADKIFKANHKQHFLTLSEDGEKVSYNQNGHRWCRKGRRTMTLQRYLNKHVGHELKEQEVERRTKLVMCRVRGESFLQELKGEDIIKGYKESKSHSCMSGDNAWKCQLYADNPDVFTLVVYDDGVGYGRMLVVKTDKGLRTSSYGYTTSNHVRDEFESYKKAKGIKVFERTEQVWIDCVLKKEIWPHPDTIEQIKYIDEDNIRLSNKSDGCTDTCYGTTGVSGKAQRCPTCDHWSAFVKDDTCRWCRRGETYDKLKGKISAW